MRPDEQKAKEAEFAAFMLSATTTAALLAIIRILVRAGPYNRQGDHGLGF